MPVIHWKEVPYCHKNIAVEFASVSFLFFYIEYWRSHRTFLSINWKSMEIQNICIVLLHVTSSVPNNNHIPVEWLSTLAPSGQFDYLFIWHFYLLFMTKVVFQVHIHHGWCHFYFQIFLSLISLNVVPTVCFCNC